MMKFAYCFIAIIPIVVCCDSNEKTSFNARRKQAATASNDGDAIPARKCEASTLRWGEEQACGAEASVTAEDIQISLIVRSELSANHRGQAEFECREGSFELLSGSCELDSTINNVGNCSEADVSWSTCGGRTETKNYNETLIVQSLPEQSNDSQGSAEFLCSEDGWSLVPESDSCDFIPPTDQPCSGEV